MSFPLEKILEIDKEEYFKNRGTTIKDYDLRSVIVEGIVPGKINYRFSLNVPEDAEIVVEYKREIYNDTNPAGTLQTSGANAYGLALIPRNK